MRARMADVTLFFQPIVSCAAVDRTVLDECMQTKTRQSKLQLPCPNTDAERETGTAFH